MINTLFVANIIVVALLIAVILLQKSEGGVLGMGGGGSKNGVFSARSATGFITKFTYILAGLFFIICILLAVLVSKKEKNTSFISSMADKEITGGKTREVKSPMINKVPEGAVQKELIAEKTKQELKKKKITPPTD